MVFMDILILTMGVLRKISFLRLFSQLIVESSPKEIVVFKSNVRHNLTTVIYIYSFLNTHNKICVYLIFFKKTFLVL